MHFVESGFSQISGRMKVTMKNGNQQIVNAPITIPSVLVAFAFLRRSLVAINETLLFNWLNTVDLNYNFFSNSIKL